MLQTLAISQPTTAVPWLRIFQQGGTGSMRKIVRLDMKSTVALFAVFYAVVGLCVSTKAAIVGDESVQCPFGWAYPLFTFYIYLTVHLPSPATWYTLGIIVITTVFYGLCGLISGATAVIAYNLVARIWPFLSARVEGDPPPRPEPGPGIGLV
jgi:hypothetical protein